VLCLLHPGNLTFVICTVRHFIYSQLLFLCIVAGLLKVCASGSYTIDPYGSDSSIEFDTPTGAKVRQSVDSTSKGLSKINRERLDAIKMESWFNIYSRRTNCGPNEDMDDASRQFDQFWKNMKVKTVNRTGKEAKLKVDLVLQGRYKVFKLISRTDDSEIYLAVDTRENIFVTLKFVERELLFRTEIALYQRIQEKRNCPPGKESFSKVVGFL